MGKMSVSGIVTALLLRIQTSIICSAEKCLHNYNHVWLVTRQEILAAMCGSISEFIPSMISHGKLRAFPLALFQREFHENVRMNEVLTLKNEFL